MKKNLLLLENAALRKRMSENNTEKVKIYSWDNIGSRLEKVYQKSIINR